MDWLGRWFGRRQAPAALRVVIEPGEPARVIERSETDGVRVAELVASIPLPPVTGGTVAFECCLTSRPDAA